MLSVILVMLLATYGSGGGVILQAVGSFNTCHLNHLLVGSGGYGASCRSISGHHAVYASIMHV